MKIYFIRHGETTGDVEGRFGGDYDDHLSTEGHKQADLLALKLSDKKIEVILTSPRIRAVETAYYLQKVTGVNVEVINDIRERNSYGVITGMTRLEAISAYPNLVELAKDKLNTIDGAETYTDFVVRFISAFIHSVKQHEGKTVAMISHGGPIRVLFRDILQLGELEKIGDCSFVELEKKENGYEVISTEGLITNF